MRHDKTLGRRQRHLLLARSGNEAIDALCKRQRDLWSCLLLLRLARGVLAAVLRLGRGAPVGRLAVDVLQKVGGVRKAILVRLIALHRLAQCNAIHVRVFPSARHGQMHIHPSLTLLLSRLAAHLMRHLCTRRQQRGTRDEGGVRGNRTAGRQQAGEGELLRSECRGGTDEGQENVALCRIGDLRVRVVLGRQVALVGSVPDPARCESSASNLAP